MAKGGSSNEKIDKTCCLDRPMYEESPTVPIQIFKPYGLTTIRPFQNNFINNSLMSTKSYSLHL